MAAGFLGLFDAWLPDRPFLPPSAADSLFATLQVAAVPGASPLMLHRALFVYAFGQAMHYAIWVRLVPDVDRSAEVPQSFRKAVGLLRSDFGRWTWPVLSLCALAPVAFFLGGSWARETYFTAVYFHIGLEAAALVRLAGGRPDLVES
jgi:hypothetical protein